MIDLRIGDQVCAYFRAPATGWEWVRTGPYRITEISTGCTCPHFLDTLNNGHRARPRTKHIHIVAKWWEDDGRKNTYYLNGYDPDNLQDVSTGPDDFLVVGERGPEPQMGLFDITHIEEADG